MTDHVEGVVEFVSNKNGMYSLKLDDGNWYGFYKTRPKCEKGDSVSFEYTVNKGFNNAKQDTLEIVSAAPPAPVTASQATATGGGWSSTDYWKAKFDHEVNHTQPEIRHQASRAHAVELFKVLLENNIIELPKTKGKAIDAAVAYVDEMATEFANKTLVYAGVSPLVATNSSDEVEADKESDRGEE